MSYHARARDLWIDGGRVSPEKLIEIVADFLHQSLVVWVTRKHCDQQFDVERSGVALTLGFRFGIKLPLNRGVGGLRLILTYSEERRQVCSAVFGENRIRFTYGIPKIQRDMSDVHFTVFKTALLPLQAQSLVINIR